MLSEIIGITKGDIVSITGSSGKTSLMLLLSQELRANKVLATTTTKIYMPAPDFFDYIYIGCDFKAATGITVIAETLTPEKKLAGFDVSTLNELVTQFDYSFIESDGANKMLLKAWSSYEPVIIPSTTKTVGVISLKLLGAEINDTNIHRYEIFQRDFTHGDKTLNLNHIKRIILHDNGLFKNSAGEKILYINMVETKDEVNAATKLAEMLSAEKGFLSKVICGSIRDNQFFCIE